MSKKTVAKSVKTPIAAKSVKSSPAKKVAVRATAKVTSAKSAAPPAKQGLKGGAVPVPAPKSAKLADDSGAARKLAQSPEVLKRLREEEREAAAQNARQMSPRPNWIPDISHPTGMYDGIRVAEKPKPFPEKTPYSPQELERLREALLGERRRLQDELTSLAGASREALDLTREHPGYSVHMAEHATDLQTAEANMGVRTIEEQRLTQVEAALDRLEKRRNRFGLCLACGNKIGIQRLIAQPHAHLCMDCRTNYERIKSRRGY